MAIPILTQILQDARAILSAEGRGAATEAKILAAIAVLTGLVEQILAWNDTPNPPARAESDLQPPILRRGVAVMNYDLKNDWVVGPIAIVIKDDEGNVVPAPDGMSFASSVDDPTGLNVVDNDGMHFTINALVQRGTFVVTHTEASNMVPAYTDTINVVEDFTPTAADSDFSDAAHATQPLPAAGP